jgi:hypothetical protein
LATFRVLKIAVRMLESTTALEIFAIVVNPFWFFKCFPSLDVFIIADSQPFVKLRFCYNLVERGGVEPRSPISRCSALAPWNNNSIPENPINVKLKESKLDCTCILINNNLKYKGLSPFMYNYAGILHTLQFFSSYSKFPAHN